MDEVYDKTARAKLLRARATMVMEHPFFASLALRLGLKEDKSCHTTWTDGQTFGYNPDYINILSRKKLVGLTAHTVMHPACGHHQRRGDRDPDIWNRACDFVINPILLDAGLTLPEGFLWDNAHEGRSAEQVYTRLNQEKTDKNQDKAEPDNMSEPPENANTEPTENQNQKNQDMPENQTPTQEDAADPEKPDFGPAGEVRDQKTTLSPARGNEPKTDWEQALVQAAANARAMGKLPKGIDLLVKERFSPALPWTELLSCFVQQSARSDYTWSRPNRRYIHQDIYFPALVSDQLPQMAVAVDTSGSIQNEELEQFSTELSAVLSMNPAQIHLVYADMVINDYKQIYPWDLPFDFRPKGGGGTDFRPVFEFLDAHQIHPFCLIFFSDMECRLFPDQAPDFPVLWVRCGQGGYAPPFGSLIDLPPRIFTPTQQRKSQ